MGNFLSNKRTSNFRQLETINIINSRQRIQANKRHQSQIEKDSDTRLAGGNALRIQSKARGL